MPPISRPVPAPTGMLTLLALVAALHPVPIRANGGPYDLGAQVAMQSEQIAALEGELAALRGQLGQAPIDPPAFPRGGAVRPWGWYAGFEFASVKARLEDGLDQDANGVGVDWELRLSPRVMLGCVNPSGCGIRCRYWQYHRQSIRAPLAEHFKPVFIDAAMTFEVHVIDLELTQWLISVESPHTVSFGIRYATLDQEVADRTGQMLFKNLQGAGPTFAYEAQQPILFRGLTAFGNLRASVLFARSELGDAIDAMDGDDVAPVFESQLGLQWRRCWPHRCEVISRIGFEGQIWTDVGTAFDDNSTLPDKYFNVDPSDHHIGFLGFIVGVTVLR